MRLCELINTPHDRLIRSEIREIIDRRVNDIDFFWTDLDKLSNGKIDSRDILIDLIAAHVTHLGSQRVIYLRRLIDAQPDKQRFGYWFVDRIVQSKVLSSAEKVDLLRLVIDKMIPYLRRYIRHPRCSKILYDAGASIDVISYSDHAESFYREHAGPFYMNPAWMDRPDFVISLINEGLVDKDQLICQYMRKIDQLGGEENFYRLLSQPWVVIYTVKANKQILSPWLLSYLREYCAVSSNLIRLFKFFHKRQRLPADTFHLICNHLWRDRDYIKRITIMQTLITYFIDRNIDFLSAKDSNGHTIRYWLKKTGCSSALAIINSIYPPSSADEQESDRPACIVCRIDPAIIVLTPCRHFGFCADCVKRMTLCPICHAPYQQEEVMQIDPV